MFKWTLGRQSTEEFYYHKLRIFSFWRVDCYLIKWSKGCAVADHKDIIEGRRHYRINILLSGEDKVVVFMPSPIFKRGRVTLFRPDLSVHCMKPTLKKGMILTFGVAL